MAEIFSEEAAREAGRLAAARHVDYVEAYGWARDINVDEIDVPGQYMQHADAYRDAFMVALDDNEN